MTKSQALYSFWASFGWPAINEQSDISEETAWALGLDKKRIEYEDSTGDFTGSVALTASLFHYSESWAEVRAKALEIREFIGHGYRVPIDGGYLWIKARNPFTTDGSGSSDYKDSDKSWRRVILNIEADFLTAI